MIKKCIRNVILSITLLNILSSTLNMKTSLENTSLMWNSTSQNKVLADSGLKGLAQSRLPAFNPMQIKKTDQIRNNDVVCIQSVHSRLSLWSDDESAGNPEVVQSGRCGKKNYFKALRVKDTTDQYRLFHIEGNGYLATARRKKAVRYLEIKDLDSDSQDQIWRFQYYNNTDKNKGYMHIVCVGSDSHLDVYKEKMEAGEPVITWNGESTRNNQKWVVSLTKRRNSGKKKRRGRSSKAAQRTRRLATRVTQRRGTKSGRRGVGKNHPRRGTHKVRRRGSKNKTLATKKRRHRREKNRKPQHKSKSRKLAVRPW